MRASQLTSGDNAAELLLSAAALRGRVSGRRGGERACTAEAPSGGTRGQGRPEPHSWKSTWHATRFLPDPKQYHCSVSLASELLLLLL